MNPSFIASYRKKFSFNPDMSRAGFPSPEVAYIDGAHVKASVNLKKRVRRACQVAAKIHEKQLREEANADREEHGEKPLTAIRKTRRR